MTDAQALLSHESISADEVCALGLFDGATTVGSYAPDYVYVILDNGKLCRYRESDTFWSKYYNRTFEWIEVWYSGHWRLCQIAEATYASN